MSQKPIHINVAQTDPVNINAEDDAAWITGILGGSASTVSGILPFGARLAVTKVSDTQVRMSSGIYAMQGFCLKIPDTELFTIQSGAQAQKRIDLIVAEYRKGSPRDSYEIKVIQGTQSADTPAPPALTAQDLHFGGTTRQEEIARVTITNTTLSDVVLTAPLFTGLAAIGKSVDGIIKGTTKVGDAHTLDGKHATDFATAEMMESEIPSHATAIPNGADLNGYTDGGIYYAATSESGCTIINRPFNTPCFYLVALKGYGCLQFFADYYRSQNIYYRNYYENKWSQWTHANANDANTVHGYFTSEPNAPNTIVCRNKYGDIEGGVFFAKNDTPNMWGGWHTAFVISMQASGALYNDSGNTFIGIASDKKVYVGNSIEKRYYVQISSDGIYDYHSNGYIRAFKFGTDVPPATGIPNSIFFRY